MVRGDFTGCTLALIAILAITAGNLKPAVGRRELLGNPESDVGSWKIQNDAGVSIKVQCYDQLRVLGSVVLAPAQFWSHQWALDPNFGEVFTCDFVWDSSSGRMHQNFNIWGHDDRSSYLFTCSSCQWKVQQDGFYFQQIDGQFIRELEWTPISS